MENPNYYAIIPAIVRYDVELNPNAKLLYAEITSLCNKDGVCWATNDYFAKLYNVSKRSISQWISLLSKKGYISVEISQDDEKNFHRYVKIIRGGIEENFVGGIEENFHNNNTSINNTSINNKKKEIYKEKKKFEPPTLEEVIEYCNKRNKGVNGQQVYDYYNEANWVDGNGNPVRNWKQKIIGVWEGRKTSASKEKKPTYSAEGMKDNTWMPFEEWLKKNGG